MKILKIIVFFLLVYCFPIIGEAYDLERNVQTNQYWSFKFKNVRYGLSDYNKAVIVQYDGHPRVKLLRPGDLLVYCQRLNSSDNRIYQVMLHITGDAIDGSLINPNTFEEECLYYVNQYRQSSGLKPLRLSKELSYAASIRAREIVSVFNHQRPNGADCFSVLPMGSYRYVGENIASNFATSKKVVDGWMDSPGHRANILDPRFEEMGIAVYINPMLEYNTYWAQMFGTK
ncbi:MAG: CAP domain-containing protein [Selenomonadaceae bacterium]|nr:CAP domain-containing protein [Selenomonadaceae bacterium]